MTLGRVYVPPSRTANQFLTTRIPTNQSYRSNGGNGFNNIYSNSNDNSSNNNVIVNGFPEKSSNFRKIEIKVHKTTTTKVEKGKKPKTNDENCFKI